MSTPVPPPGLYTQPPTGLPSALAEHPVGAADPTVLTDGQVVPRQVVPAPAAAGAFSIDLARAPQVLRDLQDARNELQNLRRDAVRLGKVDPESHDQVSLDAARALEAVAIGGHGSLVEAVNAGLNQLDGLIAAIESELAAYREADRSQAVRLDDRA